MVRDLGIEDRMQVIKGAREGGSISPEMTAVVRALEDPTVSGSGADLLANSPWGASPLSGRLAPAIRSCVCPVLGYRRRAS